MAITRNGCSRRVHAYRRLVHRLQKRRLRPRRRPVDFVGQDDVRKDRPALELERPRLRVVHRHPDDVRRQHVRRELQPVERQVQTLGQHPRQHCLANPRHVIDQQVPPAHQPHQHPRHHFRLAQKDPVDVRPKARQTVQMNARDFYIRCHAQPPHHTTRLHHPPPHPRSSGPIIPSHTARPIDGGSLSSDPPRQQPRSFTRSPPSPRLSGAAKGGPTYASDLTWPAPSSEAQIEEGLMLPATLNRRMDTRCGIRPSRPAGPLRGW